MHPLAWHFHGLCAYDRARGLQEVAWTSRRAGGPDACLALEHPSVVTLGRRASEASVARLRTMLVARSIDCVRTDRGGEATYHGPGQLVLYPIVDLGARGLGVRAFVDILEQVMIDVAAVFRVAAWRDGRGHGVWAAHGKLGSVGLRVREGVTTHGLALNVTVDLHPFSLIAPCGMPGLAMTSLAREGADATIGDVLPHAVRAFERLLFSHDEARLEDVA